jgi:hypothetical protein
MKGEEPKAASRCGDIGSFSPTPVQREAARARLARLSELRGMSAEVLDKWGAPP